MGAGGAAVVAGAPLAYRGDDAPQHEDIGERDAEEEQRRYSRPEWCSGVVHRLPLRPGREETNCQRPEPDDHRMAERKIESGVGCTPPEMHQLAGNVVDRGDMIGVEAVAQPQRVGEECRS